MVIQQGSIVLVDFDPSLGNEQKGKRPALVISKGSFSDLTNGLMIALPITSKASGGFPLHVMLDKRTKTQGEIMIEQPKTLDSKIRRVIVLELLPNDLLKIVLKKFDMIFNK